MPRVAIVAAAARREALRARVTGPGVDVVGLVGSLEEIGDLDVDVVLVPGREAFADAIDRAAEHADVAVVGLVHDARALADVRREHGGAAADGVRGWALLPDTASAEEIRAAVIAADAGLASWPVHWTFEDRDGELAVRETSGPPAFGSDDEVFGAEALTRREQDVLELLSLGLSNRRIGERLGISGHTVKFHVAAIYGKLGVSGRTAAVNRALRRGLLKI